MAWSSGLQLRVTAGNDEGRVVLLNSPEITLGRAVETSESSPGWVLFSEPTVSRIHALLQWDDENQCYVLQHRSRTNPTLVRGVPVDGYPLHLHEKVSLGLLEFELEQAEARPGKLGNAVQRPGGAPASNAGGVFDALSDYAQNSRDTQKSREHMAGMAGLIAPLKEHRVSTPYFDNLKIVPIGRTKATQTTLSAIQPLYPVSSHGIGREMLLQRLQSLNSRGIMFGHQDDPFYGLGWDDRSASGGHSDVLATCGDYPAVMGFELGGIEMGDTKSLDSVPFARIREELLAHVRRGGIVTISWHPRNPHTGGTSWVNAQERDKNTVAAVLPGGQSHEVFQIWLGRLTNFLASLCDEQGQPVPFIFRPWHENSGGWFWWGRGLCSAQEYKALWNMTQDYVTRTLPYNILWSWSPNYGFLHPQHMQPRRDRPRSRERQTPRPHRVRLSEHPRPNMVDTRIEASD